MDSSNRQSRMTAYLMCSPYYYRLLILVYRCGHVRFLSVVESVKEQLDSFKKGFCSLIPQRLLKPFSSNDLLLLLCGQPVIDLQFMKDHTTYERYNADSPQIKWMWEVLEKNSDVRFLGYRFLLFIVGASDGKRDTMSEGSTKPAWYLGSHYVPPTFTTRRRKPLIARSAARTCSPTAVSVLN